MPVEAHDVLPTIIPREPFILSYSGMIVAKDSLRQLTPWMELLVDFFEFAVFDLGVDLRCFDACMT